MLSSPSNDLPYFLFWTCVSEIINREFRLYTSSLTGKCAAEKLKKNCSPSLWTCLHHMVVLKNQNDVGHRFFYDLSLIESL